MIALFLLANLGLTFAVQRPGEILPRLDHELTTLRYSPLDSEAMPAGAFAAVYGADLGKAPSPVEVRRYFDKRLDERSTLLDQVMTDYMARRFGGLDARSFPSGVYLGVHALGPDGPPFVPITKYLAHYGLFVRHAYILVVPPSGPPIVFSASMNRLFEGHDENPRQLTAITTPYERGAYDFPSSGQALHELSRITGDPARTDAALAMLRAAEARLEAADVRYGLLQPNSNTVIGCILEDAGVMTREQRSRLLLALRTPGLGAPCRVD